MTIALAGLPWPEKNSDYRHILQETAERANDMIVNKKVTPDVPRIGGLLARHFKEIASEAFEEKEAASYSRSDLKARYRLFLEAANMVENLACDCNLERYRINLICALGKKDREKDWGWGSNWSDNTHRNVLAEVRGEVNSFISRLHSFLYK